MKRRCQGSTTEILQQHVATQSEAEAGNSALPINLMCKEVKARLHSECDQAGAPTFIARKRCRSTLPDARCHMMDGQFLAHPNGSWLTCAAKRLLNLKTSTNTIND